MNRSKADKDPAQWLPQASGCHREYAAQWTVTKLRWNLAADDAERQALLGVAEDCPQTAVVYESARNARTRRAGEGRRRTGRGHRAVAPPA
ncbi:hypothetical protein [Streptomyces sp. 3211]|uniref:hypothetical protein n=1 Tax=Streptomyces sp. 3211 TaxID=1964449 RepID=UPI0017FEFABA